MLERVKVSPLLRAPAGPGLDGCLGKLFWCPRLVAWSNWLGSHWPERPSGFCLRELPFYARVMMVSGQEGSIGDKNRLPSHLDAWSGPLGGSEAPHKRLRYKLFDTTGQGMRCGERLSVPTSQGPRAPRPKCRDHFGEFSVEEALWAPTFSAIFL